MNSESIFSYFIFWHKKDMDKQNVDFLAQLGIQQNLDLAQKGHEDTGC